MTEQFTFLFGDTTAVIHYDAPEGRPSSVTSLAVREDVDDFNQTAETAFGSASIESLTTTVDAASGPALQYPNRLYVTATTGIDPGRPLFLTNATEQTEMVWVEGVAAADYLILQNSLVYTYANADTVQSTRITATINSSWCADDDNLSDPLRPNPRWRCDIDYVVNSKNYRGTVFFDLVRNTYRTTVTPEDVDRAARGFLFRLASADQIDGGDEVIAEALRQVKKDLWQRKVTAYAQRDSSTVQELIIKKAVVLVDEHAVRAGGGAGAMAILDYDRKEYFGRLDSLVSAANAHQQVTVDGAAGTTRRAPISRR